MFKNDVDLFQDACETQPDDVAVAWVMVTTAGIDSEPEVKVPEPEIDSEPEPEPAKGARPKVKDNLQGRRPELEPEPELKAEDEQPELEPPIRAALTEDMRAALAEDIESLGFSTDATVTPSTVTRELGFAASLPAIGVGRQSPGGRDGGGCAAGAVGAAGAPAARRSYPLARGGYYPDEG